MSGTPDPHLSSDDSSRDVLVPAYVPDLLDAAAEISAALDLPRSVVRMHVAQGRVRGTCSKCGEGRYSDYTCRDGGKTEWEITNG